MIPSSWGSLMGAKIAWFNAPDESCTRVGSRDCNRVEKTCYVLTVTAQSQVPRSTGGPAGRVVSSHRQKAPICRRL